MHTSTLAENGLTYLEQPYTIVDRPLRFHLRGLSQTASGYGRKLTSTRCVLLPGEKRPRRIYVTLYSNVGTSYILVKGQRIIVREN